MRLTVLIFFLPILALAQSGSPVIESPQPLSFRLALYTTGADVSSSARELQRFIDKLDSKRRDYRNDKLFLGHVFGKTHQRYLKSYKEYAPFGELLKSGTYNCLTGTALYALILERLGFEYEVIETNHHIFLLAETPDEQILFEATDPLKGFVSDVFEIEQRLKNYRKNTASQGSSAKTYYQFNTVLYNSIDVNEIAGLLHYNASVAAYNKNDLRSSVDLLDKAILLYRSPRTEEFSRIVLLTVMESRLDKEIKEELLRKIHSIRNNKMHVVASSKLF